VRKKLKKVSNEETNGNQNEEEEGEEEEEEEEEESTTIAKNKIPLLQTYPLRQHPSLSSSAGDRLRRRCPSAR
jgi:hypothetical protein